jgi:hypothetical protein
MGISHRLRTEIGVNKTVNFEIEQEFDFLEILSLKIQQEDIYPKSCAQYGVVVGRITANNGYGIPNAKVSVFIPIEPIDESNPIITSIYPYRTPDQKNEDGYRYNLLPYEKSYSKHTPTGTFPTALDALTNETAIQIFDKYYKYVVKTNESGDYMIMGVPLGIQTVFLDVDLSDIGEFSLTPQDLIRMGRATEAQVSGPSFKSSSNLDGLPQILSLTKSIDVAPLWGDPDLCQIAISRCDFDLRDDANIDIQPTAVFMGSLISSIDTKPLRIQCKPATEMGNLCNLVAGPGQIISIRQTIFDDEYGRPILEQFNFDGGNDVIESDGSWVVDLPMNLDYVSINEFGERVFSDDPKIGIPTKSKYRFKVKWKQAETLEAPIKRGYFLVPNIREYGWTSGASDPRLSTGEQYDQFVKSYAFSLDWSDYGNTGSTIGRRMIQSAVDCEDKFFEFQYNKVYTVSGLIDLYHKGSNRGRFIGIKQITDTSCDSTNYKFPTNDGVRNFDIIYTIINFLLVLNTLNFLYLIPILHILAFIWPLFKLLFVFVYSIIAWTIYGICKFVDLIPGVNPNCVKPLSPRELFNKIGDPFKKIKIPIITYPECEMCDCTSEDLTDGNSEAAEFAKRSAEGQSLSLTADFQSPVAFSNIFDEQMCSDDPFIGGSTNPACKTITENSCSGSQAPALQEIMSGSLRQGYYRRTPATLLGTCNGTDGNNSQPQYHSIDLTLAERMNLFNVKGKYFNNMPEAGEYGGVNQIKVFVNPDEPGNITNPGQIRPISKSHLDNTLVMITDQGSLDDFFAGRLLTFTSPEATKDINLSGTNLVTYINSDGDQIQTLSATGNSKNLNSVVVNYADPNNPTQSLTTTYIVNQSSATNQCIVPKTGGKIRSIDSSWDGETAAVGTYLNLTGTTDGNGKDATFDLTITTAGQISNNSVTISNSGYDYEDGDIILISGSQIGGEDVLDDIEVTIRDVNDPQIENLIIQKFATDVEYFQVITATTYNDFWNANPPLNPNGQAFNYLYNESRTADNKNFYKSLKYRYTDNFQVIWQARLNFYQTPQVVYDPFLGFYTQFTNNFEYDYDLADIQHPIWNIPDQKELVVVFLVRGVDPHSQRQTISYDLSRLYGYDYGRIFVKGEYKLNIPVQPGLTLPRHDELVDNESGSIGADNRGIFFDSFVYDTTNNFSSFTTNLISNYSSLDGKSLDRDSNTLRAFQVDDDPSSKLTSNMVSQPNPYRYLAANDTNNYFATPDYPFPGQLYFTDVANGTTFGDSNFRVKVSTNSLYDRQHRGYYTNEYIEGGSYFYANKDIKTDDTVGSDPLKDVMRFDDFIYFSPAYNTGVTTTFLQGTKKVVMRCDRLPTSTNRTDSYGNNTFLFHQNRGLNLTFYEDNGNSVITYPNQTDGYSSGDNVEDEPSQFEEKILSSFTCQGLVPLRCYEGSGEDFGVKPEGDPCYSKPSIVRGGCYVFVDVPITRLLNDFKQLGEWKTRFKVNLAACRGVFGHTFVNNWVNGTLFAFPIKNKRLFDSRNQPFNKFCKDVVMLHPTTNNFFYRSSPFNGNGGGRFVGFATGHKTRRNKLQLQFPTTIMDLGPRDEFANELSCSSDYFGYNMQNIPQTSYQDVSNILNLFIISRQISSSFIKQLLGVGDASVNTFFSRPKARFDGDYAQSISINSEIGVEDFDFENYDYTPGGGGNNSYYVGDKVFGIFFSSNTQIRDYVSPRRIIRNDDVTPGLYDNLSVFTQTVPMYKWNINNTNTTSIFGNQKNDWMTNRNDFTVIGYQSLDRLSQVSAYYRGGVDIPKFQKGYIFNVTPAPPPETGYYFEGDLAGQVLQNGNKVTVGAPFYFYFGLVRGSNAIDKFNKKYLGIEIL